MTPRQRGLVAVGAIILVPGAAATGWGYFWPTHRLHQAEAALAAGDGDRGEQLLKELTFQSPDQPRVYLLQAQLLRRTNQPAAAQRAVNQAMRHGLPEAVG